MIPNDLREQSLSMNALGLYTWLSLHADNDGVVMTSLNDLADKTRLSFQQVRSALQTLLATKLITMLATKQPTKLATKITICYLADCKDGKLDNNNVSNNADNNVGNKDKEQEKRTKKEQENKEKDNKLSSKKDVESENDWRKSKDVYDRMIDEAAARLILDTDYQAQVEAIYANIDYVPTIKACALYWKDEEQYKGYKRKKTQTPNFVSTLKKGLKYSIVKKPYYATKPALNTSYPRKVEDVRQDDTFTRYNDFFIHWMGNKMWKVWENLKGTEPNGGWPRNDAEYQYLVSHTVGGAKGLCYVILVFNRDGWEKYYDERGFMFTYSNYIKANGMFKE